MKTHGNIPFNHPFLSIVRQLPKLVAIIMLLAMVVLPATSALASGLSQASTGTIEVIKFLDLNSDGSWQQGTEPLLANWTFDLYLQTGGQFVFQSSGVTDQTGHAYFNNLGPGTYRVSEKTQIEYIPTTPKDQTTSLSPNQTVTLLFGNAYRDVDFGDLPDNYNMTTRAQNGARHQPTFIYLGASIDTEADGVPTSNASGDNLVGPDEDGVQAIASPPVYWSQGQGTVQVTVTGGVGCLFAWVDFWDSTNNAPGADGDFTDSGSGWSEQIFKNLPLSPGTHILNFPLPLGAAKSPVWARFRLGHSFQGDCSYYNDNAHPITTHGFFEGGEVEDYYFSFTPNAVSLASFTAQPLNFDRYVVSLVAFLLGVAGVLLSRRLLVVRQQSKNG